MQNTKKKKTHLSLSALLLPHTSVDAKGVHSLTSVRVSSASPNPNTSLKCMILFFWFNINAEKNDFFYLIEKEKLSFRDTIF